MQLSLNDKEICGMREHGLGTNEICAYKSQKSERRFEISKDY